MILFMPQGSSRQAAGRQPGAEPEAEPEAVRGSSERSQQGVACSLVKFSWTSRKRRWQWHTQQSS